MCQEAREEQLGQLREQYNSVSQEAREEQQRQLDRLARQQESSEDHDIIEKEGNNTKQPH